MLHVRVVDIINTRRATPPELGLGQSVAICKGEFANRDAARRVNVRLFKVANMPPSRH